MEIELTQKPKNPIIIEGFPGLGLVATIATGFLVEHLNAKSIGRLWSKEIEPVAAIHDSKIVQPLEIFYDKKHNIIIINALSNIKGLEWDLSNTLIELCKKLNAKELISIEGISSSPTEKEPSSYYYTNQAKRIKHLEKANIKPLKEGIAMGVTAAIMLKAKKIPSSCIFVETHSALPDSRAAAKAIEKLDQLLNLEVDYKPLLKKAEEFESKLKNLINKSKSALTEKQKKELDYFG